MDRSPALQGHEKLVSFLFHAFTRFLLCILEIKTSGWRVLVKLGIEGIDSLVLSTVQLNFMFSLALILASLLQLKNALPGLFKNKDLDPPPKMSLRFVNNSDRLLNERRQRLEAWLWALMSHREVALSREMRSFLQLHLAVRAAASAGYVTGTLQKEF